MCSMELPSPPERLTPEELAFTPPPEAECHFQMLVAEYETALESGDEGWIADPLTEIRKFIGGFEAAEPAAIAAENNLAEVVGRLSGKDWPPL
jgi:hypothetical protein